MSFKEKQLGDFALEKKLGQGGMGEVYKARQVSLDRIVAVKILPKSLAAQENFIERFQREAKAAANLIHPNVIQIYSIGVEAGTPYFAMEYVEGEDLQQRMKRLGKLSYEECVEIVAGVANALACAFEKGIVHRDIKPSNIMIDKNAVVKVMDFGLAKATQDGGMNLTQSGLIMGTPNYISPEQGKGETIDSRSDIYSLGVVFYEMLTGLLPFRAETPAALIYKHAFEAPDPPTRLTADVPPFLEEICLRMLAKEPRERYPNPKALLADFNEFRRNPEYYLKGGQRRTPAIQGSGVHEQNTLIGAASAMGAPTPPAGSGGASGSGVYVGSTSGFKRAETVADHSASGATLIEAARVKSGGLSKLVLGVGVVVALGAGGFLLWGRGGGLVGGKVIFPLSKLEGRVPKGVQGFIQVGFENKSYLTYRDMQVDPKEYTLVFTKTGYKPLTLTLGVTAAGVEPPIESIKFNFEPTEEIERQYKSASRLFDNKQFKESLAQLDTLLQTAPDYPGAQDLFDKTQKLLKDFQNTAKRGQQFARERRWQQAMETLRQLPESSEEWNTAQTTIQNAELAIASLKTQTDNFERQMAEGQFDAARGTLYQIQHLVPEDDPSIAASDTKIREAEDAFAAGTREMKNGQFAKALEYFEKLLKVCPRHEQGGRLAAEAREKVDTMLGAEQKLTKALEAGEKAFREGDYARAAAEASRALLDAPGNNVAQELLSRAQGKIVEQDIAASFKALDGYFTDRKIFNLLERVDSSDPKAYQTLQADLQAFFASPIVVKSAEHGDFKVTKNAEDRASVEATWTLLLAFPDVAAASPPVHVETNVKVKQLVKMRKAGSGWIFVSFEQVGEKNVQ
jgi:tetratricopeptide (TPR) repeat protein/predicted Ser/Thr protein kinase